MTKLRIGIIGCGRIAGFLEDDPLRGKPCTHAGAFRLLPDVAIVACASREPEHAARFANKFAIPHWYNDYREMLACEHLDIVSVCTYAPTHAEMTIAAAQAGVKGIWCEKAMATSLREADDMIRACERNGTVLMVNHMRRWEEDYTIARRMIDEGSLGALQTISGTFSGHVVHTGIHLFDSMIYFAGPVRSVYARLSGPAPREFKTSGYAWGDSAEALEDRDGVAMIEFRNGVVGHVSGLGKQYFIYELDIQGTQGRIRIGNGLFTCGTVAPSKRYEGFRELDERPVKVCGSESAMLRAARDLVGAVREGRETRCSGREARRALEVACALYESEACGQPVTLPLEQSDRCIQSR